MDEKKTTTPGTPAQPAPLPVPEGRRATDVAEEQPEEGLKPTFMWGGLPVFECPQCGPRIQFPGEKGAQQLKEHIETEHPKVIVETGLVGPRGEKIYKEL